jgi:hypothetical protein
MTGPEHYREAERLLGEVRTVMGAADEGRHPPLPRVCALLSARRLAPA